MEDQDQIPEAKIITLGDSRVGKSSLIMKFIDNRFTINYLSTIGFDLKQKLIKLDNGQEVKLIIYDTAGQERFKSIATNYIKKANGILLIYDISEKITFNNIENWVEDIQDETEEKLPIVLVGNKCDLRDEKKEEKEEEKKEEKEEEKEEENEEEKVGVTIEEGQNLAQKFHWKFYETSCKTGVNVEEAFKDLAGQVLEKILKKTGGKKMEQKIKKIDNLKPDKKKKIDCCL